jgi:hypothetical protein
MIPKCSAPSSVQQKNQFFRLCKASHNRKAWLFADTSQGARASATCYSLVETAKANKLEPSVYIQHVLERIADADTLEKLEALLPWNVKLERVSKKVPQFD